MTYQHRVTNNGRQRIIATRWDTGESVWIDPGQSAVGCFRSIWHGDNRAMYSVEPAADGEAATGSKNG